MMRLFGIGPLLPLGCARRLRGGCRLDWIMATHRADQNCPTIRASEGCALQPAQALEVVGLEALGLLHQALEAGHRLLGLAQHLVEDGQRAAVHQRTDARRSSSAAGVGKASASIVSASPSKARRKMPFCVM